MNILDEIVKKTRLRVSELDLKSLKEKALTVLEAENEERATNSDKKKTCFPFKKALSSENISIIAEVKKASPSKGLICADFEPQKIALEYKKADVDCISVLTEPYFFMGDNSYVKNVKNASGKPVLRKDFIIDEAQIFEAKTIGADCILLICAILDDFNLKKFLKTAHSLNLSALVECHDEKEIARALNSNAEIIGVNNRNLKTFEVDFNNSLRLRKLVPDEVIFVSESGIKTREDVRQLEMAGVNAVLIGETFMRAENKPFEIAKLRGQNLGGQI